VTRDAPGRSDASGESVRTSPVEQRWERNARTLLEVIALAEALPVRHAATLPYPPRRLRPRADDAS